MKEERAFNRAFPAIVHRNLGNCHGVAPVLLSGPDWRHFAAAHEGKLAALKNHAANAVRKARGFDTGQNDTGHGELALQRFALRFEIDGAGKALHFLVQ